MKTEFILFAAAALTLAACSNDGMDNWNGEIRLSSSLSVQDAATRAATGIQGDAFDAGESIDVNIQEATVEGQDASTVTAYSPLSYMTGEGGIMEVASGTQPYYPTSGNGVDIYAVYPAGTGETFAIAADQSADEAYKASDLMYASRSGVARTKEAVKLTFSHLLSKVTVKLVAGAGSPDLSGAKVLLTGVMPEASFSADYEGYTLGAASGTPAEVTVAVTTAESLEGSAVIIPQTLAQKFIKVSLKNGGELSGSLDGATTGPTLVAGNEYVYTITVNLTGLNISSEITPWNSGGNAANGTAEMD